VPDDHHRIARFREAPRTDLPLAARVERFFGPLQGRFAAQTARVDPRLAFQKTHWEGDGARGVRLSASDGEVWGGAGVDVYALAGEIPEVGLTAVFAPVEPALPASLLHLGYAPARREDHGHGFAVSVALTHPCDDSADQPWRALCARHPEVADYDGAARAFRQRTGAGWGLVFAGLGGDAEAAFLFLRQAGRAFLPAYLDAIAGGAGAEEAARAVETRQRLAEWAEGAAAGWAGGGPRVPPGEPGLTAVLRGG